MSPEKQTSLATEQERTTIEHSHVGILDRIKQKFGRKVMTGAIGFGAVAGGAVAAHEAVQPPEPQQTVTSEALETTQQAAPNDIYATGIITLEAGENLKPEAVILADELSTNPLTEQEVMNVENEVDRVEPLHNPDGSSNVQQENATYTLNVVDKDSDGHKDYVLNEINKDSYFVRGESSTIVNPSDTKDGTN